MRRVLLRDALAQNCGGLVLARGGEEEHDHLGIDRFNELQEVYSLQYIELVDLVVVTESDCQSVVAAARAPSNV